MTDTSPEYIAMCDCPEVQGKPPTFIGADGTEYFAGTKNLLQWNGRDLGFTPYQHHIQGWLYKLRHDQDFRWWLEYFHGLLYRDHFRENKTLTHIASMEQLWLAFYMHEAHGKTWDGREWNEVPK